MSRRTHQLELFSSSSLDPTYEIKREIRRSLAKCALSRDQVVDNMNKLAATEGICKRISKATLDSWTKDDPGRLPSPAWLTIFCKSVDDIGAIRAMVRCLGFDVVGPKEVKILAWAEAELQKRRAAKRARIALEALEE